MWLQEFMGIDIYHLVGSFIIYSVLGWFVESIYMSFCNKKLTNRGFTFSPFCPIYGFGAILGTFILEPFSHNIVYLYLGGAIGATIFEFLVGILMLRLFGELWWDYNDKPFNYKGILCLESSIAWGFYAVTIILFLNNVVAEFIDFIPLNIGIVIIKCSLFIVSIDFAYHLLEALGVNIKEYREKMVDRYSAFKARWY